MPRGAVPAALLLALVLAAVGHPGPLALAQGATPEGAELGGMTVLPPDASHAGVSRAEWSARFSQWVISLPPEVNPGLDPTGERCGYGQSGPVFFLPAAYTPEPYDRTCVVPRVRYSAWA